MLMPKKTKFRKMQRGSRKGLSKGCRTVAFGDYGLEAVTPAWISAQQIEAMRVTASRKLKKEGTDKEYQPGLAASATHSAWQLE